MAQPVYLVRYLAAMSVVKNQAYTSAAVLTAYPTANVLMMKTAGVRVSINGTELFPISYDEISYIEAGQTYIFDSDSVVVIGKYQAVV